MVYLGRTYEELDLMFTANVPTRKFSQYQVDAYNRATLPKAKSDSATEI
jgi:hypothetical protein